MTQLDLFSTSKNRPSYKFDIYGELITTDGRTAKLVSNGGDRAEIMVSDRGCTQMKHVTDIDALTGKNLRGSNYRVINPTPPPPPQTTYIYFRKNGRVTQHDEPVKQPGNCTDVQACVRVTYTPGQFDKAAS